MTSNTMQAALYEGVETVKLKEVPVPKAAPGGAVIKVSSCSICGSDSRTFFHGNPRIKPPQILGHEVAGEIVEIGEGVTDFQVGDHVSVGADIPCGKCESCLGGKPNHCMTNLAVGYQFEGGFAEYMHLDPLILNGGPIQKFDATKVDANLAALAEPLACCLNGYEHCRVESGRRILIFGAGPIGQMLALLGEYYQASQIIVADVVEERLEQIRNVGQEIQTLNSGSSSFKQDLLNMTSNKGPDLIFTACPVVETHKIALEVIAKGGTINLFGGLPKTAPPISVSSNEIHYSEVFLTGSHGSTPEQHKKALELIQTGQVDLKYIITHEYKLSDIDKAFRQAINRDGLKVMIHP